MSDRSMIARPSSHLDDWRDRRRVADACPWPGPRPLDEDYRDLLRIGRETVCDRMVAELGLNRLQLLTGESGCGKTSLLAAGLIPALEDAGMTVVHCTDWSGSSDQTSPVNFLAEKVAAGFPDVGEEPLPSGAALFWELNRLWGSKCVVVLDQFEELLRDAPSLRTRLLKLLVDINHRTEIKLVVSFRRESLHELKPLERGAKTFSVAPMIDLTAIDPDLAEKVVMEANGRHPDTIDERLAGQIAQTWKRAVGRSAHHDRKDLGLVGLLHLQAFLYSQHGLHGLGSADADARARGREHVQALLAPYIGEEPADTDPAPLFAQAMLDTIDLKLRRCQEVSTGLDPHLRFGTEDVLTRTVAHLSSDGFKLRRGVADLLEAALGDELDILRRGLAKRRVDGKEQGRPSFDDVNGLTQSIVELISVADAAGLDLLTSSREELAADADADAEARPDGTERSGVPWAARLARGTGAVPTTRGRLEEEEDPAKVTSGVLMGLPPAAVLIEELRRYAFALEWLKASHLVRISTPGAKGAVVTLIHDGFGAALEHWSRSHAGSPAAAVHAITAPSGAEFVWPPAPIEVPWSKDPVESSAPELVDAVLLNLRWRGAWVEAAFAGSQFVNCDLRGAFFHRCTFTGATFVNCLLDGAIFSDCTIVGPSTQELEDFEFDSEPYFWSEVPADLHASILRYRGDRWAAGSADTAGPYQVLSSGTGQAAVAVSDGVALPEQRDEMRRRHQRSTDTGGLVLHGGRLSSLVFRSCRFVGGGVLSFRHVAGSGLDLVETTTAHLQVHESAVRHITITEPITEVEASRLRQVGGKVGIEVELHTSSIAQMWIGTGLSGSLAAERCHLVQLWNGSPGVTTTVTDSPATGLVGVQSPGVESMDLEEADPGAVFRAKAVRMDYVTNPALVDRSSKKDH